MTSGNINSSIKLNSYNISIFIKDNSSYASNSILWKIKIIFFKSKIKAFSLICNKFVSHFVIIKKSMFVNLPEVIFFHTDFHQYSS